MPLVRAAAAAFVVGLYSAPAAANSKTGACFEYGIDYLGYDILTLSDVESPTLCMESCAQSNDCAYWSWVTDGNICHLKSSAALMGRSENENRISGPKSCLAEGNCFSEGVDYAGYDIIRVEDKEVVSAKACQELCVLEPKCAFFSYMISNKGCYLKTASAPYGKTDNEDVISGPRECPPEKEDPGMGDMPEASCVESSVEFRGSDLVINRNVRSAAYCQQLCAAHNDCLYWTFDNNKSTCSLKDNAVRVSGRHTLGKVSGAKDCLPTNPGCHLLDTTFLGSVVKQIKGSSTFEACEQNCQNDANCEHWTWNLRTKLCQLRAAAPFGYVSDLSTVGTITGPKFCPNNDVCMEQADYAGYDLEAIEDGSVTSPIMCRARCRQTEGCEFWTFVRETKSCYLKNEDALLGKTHYLASLGKISGPRECFMKYGCFEPNTAYMSPAANKIKNVNSLAECQSRCNQNKATCGRWTYLANVRVCLLLNKTDRPNKVSFDGAMSGSDCKLPEARKNPCLTLGLKYKATETAFNASVKTVSECHFECVNTTGCTAFTFEDGVGCSLFDKEPSSLPQYPLTLPTAVSGLAKCSTVEAGEVDVCYEEDAIDGASFYAFAAEECQARCNDVPNCMFWSYNPKRRLDTCTLHKTEARKSVCLGGRAGSHDEQAVLYGDTKYIAPTAMQLTASSFDMCRQHCNDNNMAHWTYFPETSTCHLHEPGRYETERMPLAVCGTAKDPRPE